MQNPFNPYRNLRLFVVCFAALAASLPMAWVSLSKVLLFTVSLGYLLTGFFKASDPFAPPPLFSTRLLLIILMAFAASMLWSEVDLDFALAMLIKHAKLLQIVLLVYLVRDAREAGVALKVFVWGQIFILASSWLLAAGLALPWVLNDQANLATHNVVFSESYLDQSIMLVTLAAVVWHLQSELKWPRYLCAAIAVAALLNVLLLLPGRTGYVACFAVLGLALVWGLPKKLRWALLLAGPLLLVVVLSLGANKVSTRMAAVLQESQNYSQNNDTASSSGWRLNAWHRSVQAIAQKPVYGYGVGSWAAAVKRLDGDKAVADFGSGNSSNPHQEYLLWGVELGLMGPLLLLGLFACLVWDSRLFPPGIQRAAQSTVAVTAIACLFNSTLYDALIGDYLCTALGLLMALGLRRKLAAP